MARRTARFPDRKISETFLHFAAPVLHGLASEEPERHAREALQVAYTVWNAVIFADVLNDHHHLDEVRRLITGTPQGTTLVEQLIARKRALFADDERLIGTYEVRRTEDGINVRADARDPYSSPRDRG
jgi:hypothetical protein